MGQGSRLQWNISASLYIFAALMLLTLPLRWVLAIAGAAAIHELSHLVALYSFGVPVERLDLGIGGASLQTGAMHPGVEILCAGAGPMGGLLLLLFARWMPTLAVCCFVQSVFNLLPIYPLDGGRIMRCILRMAFPLRVSEIAEKALAVLAVCTIFFLFIPALLSMKWGCLPVLLGAIFLVLSKKKKKPLQC